MGNFALHALGALGLTLVITTGNIAEPVRGAWRRSFREFPLAAKLISCPMCLGVWVGAAWAVALAKLGWRDCVAFAFAVSALGLLAAYVDAYVGAIVKGPPHDS